MNLFLIELAKDFLGVTVPLIAMFAFALPLVQRLVGNRRFPGVYTLIVSSFIIISTITIALGVWSKGKPIIYPFGGWAPPIGIVYAVDYFNALIGLYGGLMFFSIVCFSVWYDHRFDEPEWYYTLLLGLMAGFLGCVYTGDLFNLFVMLEVLGISCYAITAYFKKNPASLEAAFKYGIVGATATTIYFIGLILIYGLYGSLNMADVLYKNLILNEEFIGAHSFTIASSLALALALWVFTFKAGLFPNHFWLPDVYSEAPAPTVAAFAGLSEVVGVYVAVRLLYTVFPIDGLLTYRFRSAFMLALMIMGFAGGIVGALMMMIQRDLRRLLAYSSVSHIGLMFMVASIQFSGIPDSVTTLAMVALATHIISHGFSKLILFWCGEVFVETAGTKILDEMRGVGRSHPYASLAFIIGFLNLIGVVPFIGFYSKLLMYTSFINAGIHLAAVAVVLVTAISIPGYAKAIYSIVFSIPTKGFSKKRRVEYVLLTMSTLLIALGLVFNYLYRVLDGAMYSSIVNPNNYKEAFIEELKTWWRWVLGAD